MALYADEVWPCFGHHRIVSFIIREWIFWILQALNLVRVKMLVCTSVRSWSVGIVSGDYAFCRHGNKFSGMTEESLPLMNWICLQQLNIVNKDLFLFDQTNYYKKSGPRFISHVGGDVCWHEDFRNLKNLSWCVSLMAAENNDLKERRAPNIRYCLWLSKILYRLT